MSKLEVNVDEYIELSSDGDGDGDGDFTDLREQEADLISIDSQERDFRLIERDRRLSTRALAVERGLRGELRANKRHSKVPIKSSIPKGKSILLNPCEIKNSDILIGFIGLDESLPLLREFAGLYASGVKRSGCPGDAVKVVSMRSLAKVKAVLKRCPLDVLVAESDTVLSDSSEGRAISALLASFYQREPRVGLRFRACPLVLLVGEDGSAELNDSCFINLSRNAFRVLRKSMDPRRIAQAFDSAIRVHRASE